MANRYSEAEVQSAKWANKVNEWCACIGVSKTCANSSKGDAWKRSIHRREFGLDQTMCPDLNDLEFIMSNPYI